jgi:hypothetical protein
MGYGLYPVDKISLWNRTGNGKRIQNRFRVQEFPETKPETDAGILLPEFSRNPSDPAVQLRSGYNKKFRKERKKFSLFIYHFYINGEFIENFFSFSKGTVKSSLFNTFR